ncbi:extended synaptotagmin-2-like isoform X2 [Anthonomus grandis grandis]|nr:extended synaptotagmin-2-like isoform X2 [Anthonomus grandis grandis]XP_050294973.1 extended synaptotagmin-2-like isoform X2 [Anthonomus grandis grandis]XP_050294975.1 extended synaptotagmin-2-like isoform X2 [Anthonomus grandis grandis]XP_050294976.1 extended synaptotagmin-2-like isoform X2 [Anthonomus grandis grandis]XP_050294977.1 extended synaptotagmin-2-like isoform X2 [Anthonomus grandis grandis]XP_050294978.1 extended synaptotagmin-2-like isoform X2 [Anthonomus grandis grandis]XP_05
MHDYEKKPTIDPVQASVCPEKPQDLDLTPGERADGVLNKTKRKKSIDFSNVDTNRQSDNMYVKVVVRFLQRVSLLFLGYLLCYFNYSLILPLILICTLVWFENAKSKKKERIKKKVLSSSMTKEEIINVVKDLPSWVNFPDRERAEWLNEIVHQLWPNVKSYIVKYCRGKIQTNIRKKFDSFRFEDIDFGNTPPKIDGIKVYHQAMTKDSIIIDFEVFYDGDCSINFSMSGAEIGRIKDFQMGVEIRVVLKPLLFRPPLIGGVQFFFLNIPDIDFELEGISGIPGFSYFIRLKIEEIINKKLVFPNKITKRFTKSIEAAELKSIEAEGVLRVHVFEAKDLEKKDVTGKSDPYVILNVGAQEFKTQVIKRDLNPQWDYYCEFIILDPAAQQLYFKLFDQDNFNEDEFLGSGAIDISQVIKPGKRDQWFTLENVKHGKIHFRFSWLALTADKNAIDAAAEETKLLKIENIHTALLTIYIESASNLPKIKAYKKPDPYIILTVGKNQTKSRTKKHTCNPIWDQGFYLLVRNPRNDSLIVTIIDKQSDSTLDKMVYSIKDLLDQPGMQISKEEFPLRLNSESKITISLQLRILHNAEFEPEDSETDSDDDSVKESKSLGTLTKEQLFNDSPKTSRHSSVEEQMEKFQRSEFSALNASPTFKTARFSQRLDERGRIELTMDYSELRQKLLVTVHRVANLPLKNPGDIPDPYVKLKLDGPGNSPVKYRTKVIVDSCDPEYEETFEYLLSISELPHQKLIISVKNKKMFSSRVLGQTIIELKSLQLFQEPVRAWYDLHEEEVSD